MQEKVHNKTVKEGGSSICFFLESIGRSSWNYHSSLFVTSFGSVYPYRLLMHTLALTALAIEIHKPDDEKIMLCQLSNISLRARSYSTLQG